MARTRMLEIIGEGALLGGLAGIALAAVQTHASADLHHGTTLLTLLRFQGLVQLGAVLGAAASILAASVFSILRATGHLRWEILAVGALPLGIGAAVTLTPQARIWLLSLGGSEVAAAGGATIGAVGLATTALIALRTWDAYRGPVLAPTRRVRVRGVASLAGLALLAAAISGSVALSKVAASLAAGHPSVIAISIDTLRADRLGALGNPRPLTPHLDRLAKEGVIFTRAMATAPWTKPSHASLFMSLLPFDHGARWNRTRIAPARSMLAERFRDAGYRTAAFTGGASVHGDAGFDQGFEIYQNVNELEQGGAAGHFARASQWVCELGEQPYFLFLHTYEAHMPFTHRDFAEPGHDARFEDGLHYSELAQIREGRLRLNEREQRLVADLYDGDVAQADRLVGQLLDSLENCGALANTIVTVFSDHGEDLWDHEPRRSPDHGHSLYEELLHVPLIFWRPGRLSTGVRIDTPVSLIDVAPTLLSLAALPPDRQHQGSDLSGALRIGVEPVGAPVFSESTEYGPDRFAVRHGDLKVIIAPYPEHDRGTPLEVAPLEIFDLAADPDERENLASLDDPATRDLVELVARRAWQKIERPDTSTPEDDPLTSDRRRQLRALGYAD